MRTGEAVALGGLIAIALTLIIGISWVRRTNPSAELDTAAVFTLLGLIVDRVGRYLMALRRDAGGDDDSAGE